MTTSPMGEIETVAWRKTHHNGRRKTYSFTTLQRDADDWESLGAPLEPLCRLSDALERIAQLEAERAWISVDERLPEHEATVLISGFEGNDPENKRFTAIGVFHKDGTFYTVEEGDDFYPPTHWQPLPRDPAIDTAMGTDGEKPAAPVMHPEKKL